MSLIRLSKHRYQWVDSMSNKKLLDRTKAQIQQAMSSFIGPPQPHVAAGAISGALDQMVYSSTLSDYEVSYDAAKEVFDVKVTLMPMMPINYITIDVGASDGISAQVAAIIGGTHA